MLPAVLGATLSGTYLAWLIADVIAIAILVWAFLRWRPGFLRGSSIREAANRMLEVREQQIRTQLEEAQRSREEAARMREQSASQIEQARREAEAIVERARHTSAAIGEDLERRAREEYDRIVGQARSEIEYERERAELALRRRAADIVVDAAREVVQRNLDPQTDDRLIVESLQDVRGLQ